MNRKQVSFDIILQQRILPLYFHPDAEVSIEVLKTLYAEGIRSVEYTNRGEAAFENFKRLLQVRDAEMPGLQLGIGTIKTAADAMKFC
jgi:2-dehydro-3-deoxyphosphogluconate aldolase/(4S)-4-hydroxy-2-oxoglutarate aldolase